MLRTHTYLSSSTLILDFHSDAEGGPLNLPQSPVMLAMPNFLILFVQQHVIIICSHPRPFQHTLPKYVVHLANVPQLQTHSSTTKKLRSWAVPFVFSCQAPCQASFRPLPLGLKLHPLEAKNSWPKRSVLCASCEKRTKSFGRCLKRCKAHAESLLLVNLGRPGGILGTWLEQGFLEIEVAFPANVEFLGPDV